MKTSHTFKVSSFISHFCLCLLFLMLVSCGDDKDRKPASALEVVGLANEKKAKQSKDWTWSCQENKKAAECLYRYDINNKSTHTFAANAQYKSKASATTKDQNLKDGKYYIHVQAKSKGTNQESSVKNASVTLDNTPPDDPASSSFDVPDSSNKTDIEITFEHDDLAEGDQISIYVERGSNSQSSNFLQSVLSFFSSNTNPDICVEENKAGSGTVASGQTEVTFEIGTRVGEHSYYAAITDEAGNSSACVQAFTYENTSASSVDVQVTGLTSNPNAGNSYTWRWGCNKSSCAYRHVITQSASRAFANEPYNSKITATKTITSASDNGTYYIHVQAKDSNDNVSDVETAFAALEITIAGNVEVKGLTNDTNPKKSKRWNWSCNKNSCSYRHFINQSASHTFANEPYNSKTTATKTIASANDNGTYYIHVQARDSSGNVSVVKSVEAVLRFSTSTVEVTGLSDDTTPASSKKWNWGCAKNSGTCEYRHIINKNQRHTFTNETYTSKTTATKTITSANENGTYYIHVQAKDSNGESAVESVLVILRFGNTPTGDVTVTGLEDDPTAGSSKTWNWNCTNNSGACSYRHAINKNNKHTFRANDPYDNTTTASLKNRANGTYWLHVQAKDTGNRVSTVRSVLYYFSANPITITITEAPAANPVKSKAFTWNCSNCSYRYTVNEKSAHIFGKNDNYGSTNTQTIAVSDTSYNSGSTYYVHVQAKDNTGNLSSITTRHVTLTDKAIIIKEPIKTEEISKVSVKWTWECDSDNSDNTIKATKPCLYRYIVKKSTSPPSEGHKFEPDDPYTNVTTTTKTIKSKTEAGNYYLHVQTKDSQNNISVVKVSPAQELKFELDLILKDPAPYTTTSPLQPQLHVDRTPDFTVLGIPNGNIARLYTSKECTDGSNDGDGNPTKDTRLSNEVTISSGQADLTANYLAHFRTYPIYVGVKESSTDNSIDCYAKTSISDDTPIVVDSTNTANVLPLLNYTLYKPIATGGQHTCYLSPMGEVKCWGLNDKSQLVGDGSTVNANAPPATAISGLKAKAIAAGAKHTCVIEDDNDLNCWGDSTKGQIAVNPANVQAVATGGEHTCIISSTGAVSCWGANDKGQLGIDSTADESTEESVDLGCELTTGACVAADKFKAKAITAGNKHTCVILLDENNKGTDYTGDVVCWGANDKGQLGQDNTKVYGDGSDTNARSVSKIDPVNLGSGRTAKSITAGDHHTCAVLDDDTAKCWGHNILGQLGQDDVEDRGDEASEMSSLGAISLGSGSTAKSIVTSSKSNHTCAILSDDTMKCWGNNWRGQLGQSDKTEHSGSDIGTDSNGFFDGTHIINNRNHGSGTGSSVPATTSKLARSVSSLSVIHFGCKTITSRGGITQPCTPSNSFKLKSPESIAVGGDHTCAVLKTSQAADKNTEFVKCWGRNEKGQLGQGDTTDRGDSNNTSVDKTPPLSFSQ